MNDGYQVVGEGGAHAAMWFMAFHSLATRFFFYWISSMVVIHPSLLGATPDLETCHSSVCVHTLQGIMGGGWCLLKGF